MSMTNCSVCDVSVFKEPLYRNGPQGVIGVEWRCIKHVDPEYIPDNDTRELCDLISNNPPAKEDQDGQK